MSTIDELKSITKEGIGKYKPTQEDILNNSQSKGPEIPNRNSDPIEDRIEISLNYEFIKLGDHKIKFKQEQFEGMAEKLNKTKFWRDIMIKTIDPEVSTLIDE